MPDVRRWTTSTPPSPGWGGLIDWLRQAVLGAGNIAAADLGLMWLADTPEEALGILEKHLSWKAEMIRQSPGPSATNLALLEMFPTDAPGS